MKQFTIVCDFPENKKTPVHIYVGEPSAISHPLTYQYKWLAEEHKATIPAPIMKNFANLHSIAKEHNISFEELCAFALADPATRHSLSPTEVSRKLNDKVIGFSDVKNYIHGLKNKRTTKAKQPVSTGRTLAVSTLAPYKKDIEANLRFCSELSKSIWPHEDGSNAACRGIFLGMSLYLAFLPEKPNTISNIYKSMISEDLYYCLCVVLDTIGKQMHPLSLELIHLWLSYPRDVREQVKSMVAVSLATFCCQAPIDGKIEHREALQEFRNYLFHTPR